MLKTIPIIDPAGSTEQRPVYYSDDSCRLKASTCATAQKISRPAWAANFFV